MAVSPLLLVETPRFGGGSSASGPVLSRPLAARQAAGFDDFVGSLPVSGALV